MFRDGLAQFFVVVGLFFEASSCWAFVAFCWGGGEREGFCSACAVKIFCFALGLRDFCVGVVLSVFPAR